MKDFFKNNKVILAIILALGVVLRLLDIDKPVGIWSSEYHTMTLASLKSFNFFDAIRTNAYAPLHSFYLRIWSAVFRDSSFMLKLSSLLPNILGCLVLYHAGKNYQTKDNSINIGLTAAVTGALSSFLIYFSLESKTYSMIFLLSSLILLFSIKMYENPSKKSFSWLLTLNILLILEHTIGLIFVIFNTFSLIAFGYKNAGGKKKKGSSDDGFIPVMAGIILCLPLIPYVARLFAHPTYFAHWWNPFNWSKVFFLFTDLFSPVLKNVTEAIQGGFFNQVIVSDSVEWGFLMFCLIPSSIALFLIIKSNIESKKIDKYFLSCALSTFLTILIITIAGKITFLTKYFVELYPIMIMMASVGFSRLNSKNTKITLATIYISMSIFYIVAVRIFDMKLI